MQPIVFVAVAVCLIAVGSVQARPDNGSGEHMKWVDKCKEETKLTVRPDYTKSADEIPENAKCFMKCMVERFGLTPEHAEKLDLSWADKFAQHHAKEKYTQLKTKVDECKKLIVNDSCDSIARGLLCLRAVVVVPK